MIIENFKFKTRPETTDESIIQNVVGSDEYDAKNLIKPGDVVVDIGGHIGSFSVLAASLGARVITYEPFQGSYDLLVENMNGNTPDESNFVTYKMAVMGEVGKRTMHIRQRNFGGSNFYQESNNPDIIDCITLDDVFETNELDHIDFLKLDCEGSEFEIIEHSDKLPVIKVIAFEYVGDERRAEMLNRLSDYEIVKDKHNDQFGTVVMKRK